MAEQLTVDDARQSLTAHVAAKGAEIFEKYGPRIGWKELLQILADRVSPGKQAAEPPHDAQY